MKEGPTLHLKLRRPTSNGVSPITPASTLNLCLSLIEGVERISHSGNKEGWDIKCFHWGICLFRSSNSFHQVTGEITENTTHYFHKQGDLLISKLAGQRLACFPKVSAQDFRVTLEGANFFACFGFSREQRSASQLIFTETHLCASAHTGKTKVSLCLEDKHIYFTVSFCGLLAILGSDR